MTRATVPVLASAGTSATASAAVLSALNFSVCARGAEPDDHGADRDVADRRDREGQPDPTGGQPEPVQAAADQQLAGAAHRARDDQGAGRRGHPRAPGQGQQHARGRGPARPGPSLTGGWK